jgi:hypothetical protein
MLSARSSPAGIKLKEQFMKLSKFTLATLAVSVLCSSAAFAAPGNKGTLHLTESITVEGKQLKPGYYAVEWDGTGSDVKLNISKGKDVVATVPARVDTATGSHFRDGYGVKTEADGSKSLTTIFVSGKELDLTGGQNAAATTPAR